MNQDEQIEIERRQHVAAVVNECNTAVPPVPLNHGIVAAILESRLPGFSYDQKLDDFHRHLDTMDTAPAEVPAEDIRESEPVVEPEAAPLNIPELRARHLHLDQHAASLRASLFKLQADRQVARAELADAIAIWSHTAPKVSAEQNVRDFLAASQAEREQAKKNGASRVPAGGFGRSVIDRTAAYSHGSPSGDGSDFVRKQIRVGFRRRPPPLPSGR